MQCTRVKTRLADYAVGLLNEREREAVAEHLAHCPSCAAEWRALQRVDRLLSAVEPEEPPAPLWQTIRMRIGEELQRQRTPFWRSWLTAPRLALGGVAVAAAWIALLYFGVPRPAGEERPLPESAEQLMHAHQIMRWGDPLSDKVALGMILASRSQEVP